MLKIENGIHVVKFGTEWCGPCKVVNKNLDKLQQEFSNINFQSIDVDDYPDIGKFYQIKNLPTIILFKDGKEVNRIIGAAKISAMRKALRDILLEEAA